MIITIKKPLAQVMGYNAFKEWGISEESWRSGYRDSMTIDLTHLSTASLDGLHAQLQRFKAQRGVGVILADIDAWKKALAEGAAMQKPRTVRQIEALLKKLMVKVPGHRLYRRHEEGAMLAYYVKEISYQPPYNDSRGTRPATVTASLVYEEANHQQETAIIFSDESRHIPILQALAEHGYSIENPMLRHAYMQDKELWITVANAIGKQFWATGKGLTETENRYGGSSSSWTTLDRDGQPTRGVVDLYYEGDEGKNSRSANVNNFYWTNLIRNPGYDPEKDESTIDETDDDDEDTMERPEIEIPIHPWIKLFDLSKHIRVKVHVRQLEEYVYDKAIAEKLILPKDQKDLIKLLIDTKGGQFTDIVRGKGGGAVVLLSGEPGTGKTLTAEVYAENEERPLYSVQCSQLGINPDTLEKSLMRVFERAKRWNAVMLLDEADVYVHERGRSMNQNAIVGVFLRVLEYQNSVLFLTTNRPDDVDDAIGSRCIARIHYHAPGPDDAALIWRVLAAQSALDITDRVISQTVERHPDMTGRDIKNILKLARLMPGGLTVANIEFVHQFKPTGRASKTPIPAMATEEVLLDDLEDF